ncbi:MAG: DUF6076 domain-containing protein [Ruminococcus sp.]|nr:DUF6076 domain-containing protein [Ruminococcus sp.]
MNNTKIYTIEDFLKDIYNKTKERVLQELNWNALYNITLRKKEKYNLLSCSISGSCGGLKFSYCSDDKQSFKVGDISNDFYQCLTYDRYTEMYTIDEENLNNFIKKYRFPPFYIEKPITTHYPVINYDGLVFQKTSGVNRSKEKELYFPIEHDINNYKLSILSFNDEHFISPDFVNNICHAKLGMRKTETKSEIYAISNSMNDIIAYDMLYASKHHRFKTCECCGRFFFANRSNNQSYCQGCKNNSKEKLLSQNTKRNSLIRKLNRNYPYESDDFKSEILIKNGFEPLKKGKKEVSGHGKHISEEE